MMNNDSLRLATAVFYALIEVNLSLIELNLVLKNDDSSAY